MEEAKGRVKAAEREATAIEGEVAALRSQVRRRGVTARRASPRHAKVTALEKDAEGLGRARQGEPRGVLRRAERDLSDLRDQNAAQSTALIRATDTAQADRASRDAMLEAAQAHLDFAARTRKEAEEAAARDAKALAEKRALEDAERDARGLRLVADLEAKIRELEETRRAERVRRGARAWRGTRPTPTARRRRGGAITRARGLSGRRRRVAVGGHRGEVRGARHAVGAVPRRS